MTDKSRDAAQQAPMAYYALVIKADSGYESTTEGRCTADQYGAAMAALHGTAALAQQDAQPLAHLPKGCTHYTRTGDERVTLHFESEASADAWHDAQAASPTPPVVKESLTDQIDNASAPAGKDQYTIYGDGFHDGYLKGRAEGWEAAVSEAQQHAQAVPQDEIVAAWKSGMTIQYFVTIGYDDEWTDYTNPTPPDTSGTRLAWRVKPGQRSNAAPTPPAPPPEARQWTGLTDIGVYFAITAAGNPPNPMSEEFFAWCEKFADAIEANLKERNA